MDTTDEPDRPPGFDAVLDGDTSTVVVALDFDGVVNAPRPRWGDKPRKKHVRTAVGEFLIVWSPLLRDQIKALGEHPRVQLMWLTSWGPEIGVVEDLLGLPRLPRGIETLLPSAQVPAVKHAAIDELARTGRPYVWCDDEEADDTAEPTEVGPHLEIRPKSKHGLSPDDIERIWAFIHDPFEGQRPGPVTTTEQQPTRSEGGR